MLQLVDRIKDELRRIQEALPKFQNTNLIIYNELYAAQQALCWVLETKIARSPYDMIMNVEPKTAVLEEVVDPLTPGPNNREEVIVDSKQ